MKAFMIAAGLATAAVLASAPFAAAQEAGPPDREAGVPLTPSEAAGSWTVASQGQDLCVLTMGAAHTVRASAACRDALPGGPVGWQPTKDGMEMVDANGKSLIAFHRWSNSLFVSHRSSGVDIQLRRGG